MKSNTISNLGSNMSIFCGVAAGHALLVTGALTFWPAFGVMCGIVILGTIISAIAAVKFGNDDTRGAFLKI